MKTILHSKIPGLATTVLCCFLASSIQAEDLITNGGFESGLAGWTKVDQFGGDGSFYIQTGTTSPINAFTVPSPSEGSFAAMTDAQGPGSHVLYQDFAVASGMLFTLNFSLFIQNSATAFSVPALNALDFSTPSLNQQARVDIMKSGSDPFSLAADDILQTVFQTSPGDPLVSGYNDFTIDVTPLLLANQGGTLRLRFAEVDNVNYFNFGVDDVSLNVPETLPWAAQWITIVGILAIAAACRRWSAGTRPLMFQLDGMVVPSEERRL